MDERQQQAQWEAHTLDEDLAIRQQQGSAGPTHEPHGRSTGERLRAGVDAAALEERARSLHLLRSWSDPARFTSVTGPIDDQTRLAVTQVLAALEAELRGPAP